jgi:two-component system, cell cycle sensor histidine kinase and response regulator CckA
MLQDRVSYCAQPVDTEGESSTALRPKILIVDDEPLICESLKELLKIHGYESNTASSGEEARAILSKSKISLALLDMNLPDTNGHRLMEYIRTVQPDALVIMITGNATMDSAIGALRRGAYDYVQKPFEYDNLLKTIQNAINQIRLQAENEIINRKLRSSEERHRYLIQNSPDIIYTLDENGCFTLVSHAAETLLGYKNGCLIGRHYSTIVYENDQEKAKGVFNNRRTGERAASGFVLRLMFAQDFQRRKEHETDYLTVELKANGMYEKIGKGLGNRYVGTYGVARDISERLRLDSKLNHAQKMEAVGTLAGGIAHDFNNLLMGVQGYASIMALELGCDHPFIEKITSIEQYVQRGAELTKQLLGFARRGKYDIQPVNLNKLVRGVATMFGRTRKEITIFEHYDQNLWTVEVDPGQIEQVLLNLFLNASHAMPGGGNLVLESKNIILEESFSLPFDVEPGEYVMISVADNGIGMDEEIQRRIFEPFFTTNEMGSGTGLGLASAYGIIKNHNGIIEVKSQKGEGASFRFYLPASYKRVKDEEIEENIQILRDPGTILIVDDEDMIVEVGGEILKALGYEVIVAKSGDEAIQIYKQKQTEVDIVMLDMIMPGMGGGETFDRLKEIDPHVKVLLCSGYSVDGKATDILNRGCNQFIQKPFNIKELSLKLQELLRHNRS